MESRANTPPEVIGIDLGGFVDSLLTSASLTTSMLGQGTPVALIQPAEPTTYDLNGSSVREALASEAKWPLRRTVLFVVATSTALWLAIAVSIWHLI